MDGRPRTQGRLSNSRRRATLRAELRTCRQDNAPSPCKRELATALRHWYHLAVVPRGEAP